MANKIVYMRWGELYTEDHVSKLEEQVNKNCSVDYEFCTMESCHKGSAFDRMQELQDRFYRGGMNPESSITEREDSNFEREDAGGFAHFRKYLMFMRDKEEFKEGDVILYIDLDTLVTGDLAYFFDLDMERPWITRSWQFQEGFKWKRLYHLRSCPYFNSSVMVWKVGQNMTIFNELTNPDHDEAVFFQYGINDNWLFHRFGPNAYDETRRSWFNFFEPEVVVSDKRFLTSKTLIHTLAGMTMIEKNKLCLQ